MSITEKILNLLNSHKISYKKTEHEPVISSQDAARIRGTDLSMGAKALVFFADNKPLLIVVPGDKKVDTNRFKKQFKIEDLRMPSKDELITVVGVERGGVPPFGSVLGLKTYCDKEIKEKDKIVFNAGSKTVSILMNAKDYVLVENPILGDFSETT